MQRARWTAAALVWIAVSIPSASRANIVLIGDSIFWGLGGGGGANGVAFQLQRELKGMYVFNYSAPGATMGGTFAPPARNALYLAGMGSELRLAVVALGVNDWRLNVPLDYFSAKYEEFVAEVQQRIPKVACVAPLWSDRDGKPNAVGAKIDDYRAAISRVCRDKPGRYFWNGLAAIPGNEHFFVDGLHPNRHGHRRYAKWLRDRVRKVLPRPPAAVMTRRAARQQPANPSPSQAP
jgi:lysophospholipase L1-like esterase